MTTSPKIAVVLLNLGGPTHQEGVKPFLFNLFKDPCIIPLPAIMRYPLAWLISTLRTKKAQAIYAELGGKSPLNDNTQAQCDALEDYLQKQGINAKCFMCMRYAPPMTQECVQSVADYAPDHVVVLPLYPQFSTTTTKSSFEAWDRYAQTHAWSMARRCCYPISDGYTKALAHLIQNHLDQQSSPQPLRLLFSAHGIPTDCVTKRGDPYAHQVEHTINRVMEHVNAERQGEPLSSVLCYQSRVGPKKWLTPTLDDALKACHTDQHGAVVIPISFVSDHSETLVELDIQYKQIAHDMGLLHYSRVPSLNCDPEFIAFLGDEVTSMLRLETFSRVCPKTYHGCGFHTCHSLSGGTPLC